MLVTPDSLRSLQIGFKGSFQRGLSNAAPVWNRIATRVPSTGPSETYGWLGQWPKLREWIGDKQFKSLEAFGYSIVNKDFESSVEVDRNDIEDDRLGVYAPMFEESGRSASVHIDELVFDLAALGNSTVCYDGQFFFDTDHPEFGSTVSNFTSGAGALWMLLDTSRSIKPFVFQDRKAPMFVAQDRQTDDTVFTRKKFRYSVEARRNVGFGFWQMAYGCTDDLDETNFNIAYNAIMNRKGDTGIKLGLMPTILVCGPSRRVEAEAILKKEKLASGASNTNYERVELLVTPYLT